MEYLILAVAIIIGFGKLRQASRDIARLRQELAQLRDTVKNLMPGGAPQASPAVAPVDEAEELAPAVPEAPEPMPVPAQPVAEEAEAGARTAGPSHVADPAPDSPGVPVRPASPPVWLAAIRRWLFTGNLVAKFGLLILFIGVGFLLKYAAENYTIPIELRLAAIVLSDVGMLAWAWRIRAKRRDISLPTQGVAIAILMLVVFGAYQRYGFIPAGLAFGMLVVLTAFTCMLALLQDAVWLAAFGISGGFAGPVMLSAGGANHVALFSYYALLNAGIFAIAFRRSWRMLNLLGFAFTFVIGTGWGILKYTPDYYASAQAFLILFFLFYVAIGISLTGRATTGRHQYVDVTLVLGTPLLGFGIQYGLVKDMPFGLAFSALAIGGFYVLVAQLLFRRAREKWQSMVEAFLALGVVFGTLTIPLALDGRWTSGAWALEGCGFVWFGLRQQQARVWIFGLVLQAGAWIAFAGALGGLNHVEAVNSNLWLGFLLLAGSTLGIATNFRRQGGRGFDRAANGFLAIASCWLLAGAWAETILRANGNSVWNLLVASAIGTAFILSVISSRLQWNYARTLALIAQLAGAASLTLLAISGWTQSELQAKEIPLLGTLMIAVSALITSWNMQRKLPEGGSKKIAAGMLAWGAYWWFSPSVSSIAAHATGWLSQSYPPDDELWTAIRQVLAATSAIGFVLLARRLKWDQLRWLGIVCWAVLTLRMAAVLDALYFADAMPAAAAWISLGLLWCAGELLLYLWPSCGWKISTQPLQLIHLIRTGGPWLAIWPAGRMLVANWLYGTAAQQELLAQTGWTISGSWSHYLPAWAMMFAVVWLIVRSSADSWPARPVGSWYRRYFIPAATAWVLLLVAVWNLVQSGEMEPLPYLPLLNPLDLTTGFAAALAIAAYRMVSTEAGASPGLARAGVAAAYVWFNLMLLRSAAHYLGIAYRADELMKSLFVQAMLSLVWSMTALVLMRYAVRTLQRNAWLIGAALLGIVVGKLFLVDLASSGSIERIVSFVGVGALMLAIGYLAPYPKRIEPMTASAVATE